MGAGTKSIKQPILSLILLTVLGTIGASILIIHSSFKPAPQPVFLENPTLPTVKSSTTHGLSLSSPTNFKKAGSPEKYDRETLFEKINGKAPLYLDAGFIELASQRFIQVDDSSQWFELYIYDMATTANAFSVYSTQRRYDSSTSQPLSHLRHYTTENGLYLQLGRFYMEYIGSSQSLNLQEAMVGSVLALLAKNRIKTTPIKEITLFPTEDLNPNSLKLYLANTFGSQALSNTFIGQYLVDGQPITGFISNQQDSAQAEHVAGVYYQFLLDSGATPLENSNSKIKYFDLFGTIESVFQTANYVGGIHEGDNLKNSQLISERLLKRLQASTGP